MLLLQFMSLLANSRSLLKKLNTIGTLNTYRLSNLIGEKRNKLIVDYHTNILKNGDIFTSVDDFCKRIRQKQYGIGPKIQNKLLATLPEHFYRLHQKNLEKDRIPKLLIQ